MPQSYFLNSLKAATALRSNRSVSLESCLFSSRTAVVPSLLFNVLSDLLITMVFTNYSILNRLHLVYIIKNAMNCYKILQKQFYSLLSSRWGLAFVTCTILLLLISIIQFGEVKLVCNNVNNGSCTCDGSVCVLAVTGDHVGVLLL